MADVYYIYQHILFLLMVSDEEFGSLLAEYEGFRDTLMDEIAKLRQEIENIKEDLKDLRKVIQEEQQL